MSSIVGRSLAALVVIGGLTALGYAIHHRLGEHAAPQKREKVRLPVPVEVAPVERAAIARQRTFSGTLESPTSTVVAPKVGGRIESLAFDVGDDVPRGAVVALLDDDEFRQAVAQAEADLEVARAHRAEAVSALEIAKRGLARVKTLKANGVASDLQLDAAEADELARRAELEVAEAQVTRAQATIEAARIRLGYTRVTSGWAAAAGEGEGDATAVRTVAARHVEEGDTVSANSPLLTAVVLDPLLAVIHVGERDFAALRIGQTARFRSEAYPGEEFEGRIRRISPQFDTATRQVRVELAVANPDRRLRPGMFVRTTITLESADDTVVVPVLALTRRADTEGLFLVGDDGATARWVPVSTGLRQGDRIQLVGELPDALRTGCVITLGQHLIDDGSAIRVTGDTAPERAAEGAR